MSTNKNNDNNLKSRIAQLVLCLHDNETCEGCDDYSLVLMDDANSIAHKGILSVSAYKMALAISQMVCAGRSEEYIKAEIDKRPRALKLLRASMPDKDDTEFDEISFLMSALLRSSLVAKYELGNSATPYDEFLNNCGDLLAKLISSPFFLFASKAVSAMGARMHSPVDESCITACSEAIAYSFSTDPDGLQALETVGGKERLMKELKPLSNIDATMAEIEDGFNLLIVCVSTAFAAANAGDIRMENYHNIIRVARDNIPAYDNMIEKLSDGKNPVILSYEKTGGPNLLGMAIGIGVELCDPS